jgi:hypothetical protein
MSLFNKTIVNVMNEQNMNKLTSFVIIVVTTFCFEDSSILDLGHCERMLRSIKYIFPTNMSLSGKV